MKCALKRINVKNTAPKQLSKKVTFNRGEVSARDPNKEKYLECQKLINTGIPFNLRNNCQLIADFPDSTEYYLMVSLSKCIKACRTVEFSLRIAVGPLELAVLVVIPFYHAAAQLVIAMATPVSKKCKFFPKVCRKATKSRQ